MGWFILVVGVLLLLIGTPIALAWWRLAQRAAPYRDEKGKPARRVPTDDAEVIVIPPPDGQKR